MVIRNIEDIAASDFEGSPYWMFYSGHHGEYDSFTTLVPQSHPDYCEHTLRLILTTYHLASGLKVTGYFYEDPDRPFQHTLFVGAEQVSLWSGIRQPTPEEIAILYANLKAQPEEVFPIAWETFGQEYRGIINGFGYFGPTHIATFVR